MLNIIRSHAKSWVVKLLLGFLALTFAIWGVGDYVNSDAQKAVAEVNGASISQREFSQSYEHDFERMRKLFGGKLDKETAERMGMKEQSLALLINRALVHEEIRKLRLNVSPEALQQMIASTPAFQVEGKFDAERYAGVLRASHMSPVEYEMQLAGDTVVSQYERSLRSVTKVPDLLLEDIYRTEQEKRGAQILSLSSADLMQELRPTDAQLETYLKENGTRFTTEPRVKLRYAILDSDSLRGQIQISEQEIQAHYDELASEVQKKESRHVRHILANTDGTPAGDKSALEKLQKAQQAMASGTSFEQAARTFSEDVTAQQGGDLGEVTQGILGSEAFDQAAFSLAKGEVSAPVKSESGYHLIRVDAIQSTGLKPLEKMREEIKEQLFQAKAQEMVYDRSVKLEDQLYASGELRALAKEMNLRYRETEFISMEDKGLVGIETHAKFQEVALATAKGTTSPMVELDDARFFVLEVVDRQEPRAMTLAEARKEVEQAWREDEARRLARERMEALLKKVQGGGDWNALAKSEPKVKAQNVAPFTFGDKEAPASAAAQRILFRLTPEAPLHSLVIDEGNAFLIVRLGQVVEADMKGLEAARAGLRGRLEMEMGEDQFTSILLRLGSRAKVQVNQDVLKRF